MRSDGNDDRRRAGAASCAARSLAAAVATAAVVVSAALGSGRGHWAAALVALPLLAAAVIIARIDVPAAPRAPRRPRSCSCSRRRDRRARRARRTTRAGPSPSTSPRPPPPSLPRSSRSSSRSAASRSRSGPWRDYVTLTKPRIMSLLLLTGAAGMFVGAAGLAATLAVRRHDDRARARLRRLERAQPRAWTRTSTG